MRSRSRQRGVSLKLRSNIICLLPRCHLHLNIPALPVHYFLIFSPCLIHFWCSLPLPLCAACAWMSLETSTRSTQPQSRVGHQLATASLTPKPSESQLRLLSLLAGSANCQKGAARKPACREALVKTSDPLNNSTVFKSRLLPWYWGS